MSLSSKKAARLSALGITAWRRRGVIDDAPTPAMPESAVTEPVVAEPVVTEPVVAEPVVAEPAVTEPAVTESARPMPAARPAPFTPVPRFAFECCVVEDHLLLVDADALTAGQGARAQLSEAADALRVLYLQCHGALPKGKIARHRFVWPQLEGEGLTQDQAAAEAALLAYVGRVLADKGRLLVLTAEEASAAVAAQLRVLSEQLPQARFRAGRMPVVEAEPGRSRQALWMRIQGAD
jgi:hypothetical protein